MNFGFHPVTQHAVDHLVPLYARLSGKSRMDNPRFEMATVTTHRHLASFKPRRKPAPDIFWSYRHAFRATVVSNSLNVRILAVGFK